MHSPVAYYLLLVYFTIVMSPLLPQVMDSTAHLFNNENHMLSIHARFGNNHARDSMACLSEQQAHDHQQGTKELTQWQVQVHENIAQPATLLNYNYLRSFYPTDQATALKDVLLSISGPPPKQHLYYQATNPNTDFMVL